MYYLYQGGSNLNSNFVLASCIMKEKEGGVTLGSLSRVHPSSRSLHIRGWKWRTLTSPEENIRVLSFTALSSLPITWLLLNEVIASSGVPTAVNPNESTALVHQAEEYAFLQQIFTPEDNYGLEEK